MVNNYNLVAILPVILFNHISFYSLCKNCYICHMHTLVSTLKLSYPAGVDVWLTYTLVKLSKHLTLGKKCLGLDCDQF